MDRPQLAAWLLVSAMSGGIAYAQTPADRSKETVTVHGSVLASLWGRPVQELALFRYEAASGEFVPIPFQIDERLDRVFNPGTPGEFTESMYDVLGEDDGLLDADDELAFRLGDAGVQAPLDGCWVEGADLLRHEILASDNLQPSTPNDRWVYLFTGPSLTRSAASYVTWDGREISAVTTAGFEVDFQDRWLLTGLRALPPCGSGADLIDRFKGRAEPMPGLVQDEEDWNGTSTYLGGYAGPIRAIRYVQGARSGVNTVHHDVVDSESWRRQINLRVHPLEAVRVYLDWLPSPGATFFTSSNPAGVPMDGQPDSGVGVPFPSWVLMRTAAGGNLTFLDVPSSPLYQSKTFYWVDDASYDDLVPGKAVYGDDDDSAFGANGFSLLATGDSDLDPIRMGLDSFPLCANVGDETFATTMRERWSHPVETEVLPQAGCDAVRSLEVTVAGDDVVLGWAASASAEEYHIHMADSPAIPRTSWAMVAETTELNWTDPGAAPSGPRFYSVVCARDEAEGPQ